MQVLGICSSPRKKSNTAELLSSVLEGASDAGCTTESVNLCSYAIDYCTGCETCYRTGSCIHNDEFTDVYELMLSADGIVLASPNYIDQVTAQMKTLFDRMGDTIHCQRFSGKYAVAVSTAGGSGADDVAGYMNHIMFKMGADVVGSATAIMAEGEDAFAENLTKAYELGIRLANSIKDKVADPEQKKGHDEVLSHMKDLIRLRKDTWINEYEYFQKKKWI